MPPKNAPVRFQIDRSSTRPFFDQVQDQLINLVHFGALSAGHRLPTVRQLALDGGINLKTAFKIYRSLARAGLVEIRPQSGIFVRSSRGKLEQAYRHSVREFLDRVKGEAAGLNLTPRRLAHLLAIETGSENGFQVTCAVLECNREQTHLFAAELERKLGVKALPVELFAPNPPRRAPETLRGTDFLVTTDFHWEEGLRFAQRYRKKILRLRLDPGFLKMIMSAARKGPFLMILTDTAMQQRFRQALAHRLKPAEIDRIRVVNAGNRAGIEEASHRGGCVYVSPLCEEQVLPTLGRGVRIVRHDNMIAADSLQELKENLLFYPLGR